MNRAQKIQWHDFKARVQPNSRQVVYELMFASLIPPFTNPDMKLDLSESESQGDKRILIKKSYLMLTWFYYMSITKSKAGGKMSVSLAILPSRRKSYTLQKAPMAHKTNSKEQFCFKFYFYKISVKTSFTPSNPLNTVSKGTLFALNIKQNFPFFETNLMLLKYALIRFYSQDPTYFSYYKFMRSKAANRRLQ